MAEHPSGVETNEQINALVADKASGLGGTLGIQVDKLGFIVEGSVQAIAFVFKASVYLD